MTTTPLQQGFTIVELMITLFVAAILAALAAPSFTSMIQDNRLITQVNELQASIALARSEAIKRNRNIGLCRSSNGSSCGGNWESGWITFIDADSNDAFDAGEVILRVHNAIGNNITLRSDNANNILVYTADGLIRPNLSGTFTFCDDRGASEARGIIVSNTGRARLAIDDDANGTVEDAAGNNVSCP